MNKQAFASNPEITDKNSINRIIEQHTRLLIIFFEEECLLTQLFFNVINQVKQKTSIKIFFALADLAKSINLLSLQNPNDFPAIILFENGRAIVKMTGFFPSQKIIAELSKYHNPLGA